MGEGEGQASEKVGFREALEDLRRKKVQRLLFLEETVRWIGEATSKVDPATSGLTGEASASVKRSGGASKL